jgi:hypothetical protein
VRLVNDHLLSYTWKVGRTYGKSPVSAGILQDSFGVGLKTRIGLGIGTLHEITMIYIYILEQGVVYHIGGS